MRVKNIVFDINGVLVNRPVLKNIFKLKAMPWDFYRLIKLFSSPQWDDYNRGKYSNDEEVFRAMGFTDTKPLHDFMKKFYSMELEEDRQLAEFIKRIRKTHRVYILTNQAVEEWKIIKQCDIVKNTDGIVVSCEAGYTKPEKEIYQLLLDKFDLKPQETVFVDDRERNVEVAKELGFHGVRHRKSSETIKEIEALLNR